MLFYNSYVSSDIIAGKEPVSSSAECIALEKDETVMPDEKIATSSLSALSAQKTPNVKSNVVVSTAKKTTGIFIHVQTLFHFIYEILHFFCCYS